MSRQTFDEFVAEHFMQPRFWLGEYHSSHRIGVYGFVAFRPWDQIDSARARTLLDTHHYLVFVEGKDTGVIADSLDMALILAVSYRYDGQNTRAPHYIARMLGLETRWSE